MDKIKFHKEFLDEAPSEVLTLVIKNYMTRDGLSRRIAQDEQIYDSFSGVMTPMTYEFRGPMGKGLDFQPTGIHIAFTAGTGVLPFLDLVAYLIRLNLGLCTNESSLNDENDLNDREMSDPNSDEMDQSNSKTPRSNRRLKINFTNFKFILYVSYPTPEEAIGRDLCLGLQTIVNTMKRDNFEYHERYSQITTQ